MVKSFLGIVFVLSAFSCAKIEDETRCVASKEKEPIVLSPTRSYEEARSLAQQSIALVDKGSTRAIASRSLSSERGQCVTMLSTRGGEQQIDTLMYVFNFEDNAGFSVIAANRTVDPILAVTENGYYRYGENTGVENFDFYMNTIAQGLSNISRNDPPAIDTVRTTPKFKRVNVNEHRSCDPFVQVSWGQHDLNNAYCTNGLFGCIAVAMGQIMSVYQHPESITTSYTGAPHAGETVNLNWELMIGSSMFLNDQISILLREIGERVGMTYDPGASGAMPSMVPDGFKSFGYSCDSDYSSCEQFAIFDTLDNGRPVYMRGNETFGNGGHAWVADGYEYSRVGTEYYEEKLIVDFLGSHYDYVLTSSTVETVSLVHYNWGWDGDYNGYFIPSVNCDSGLYDFSGVQMLTSVRLE